MRFGPWVSANQRANAPAAYARSSSQPSQKPSGRVAVQGTDCDGESVQTSPVPTVANAAHHPLRANVDGDGASRARVAERVASRPVHDETQPREGLLVPPAHGLGKRQRAGEESGGRQGVVGGADLAVGARDALVVALRHGHFAVEPFEAGRDAQVAVAQQAFDVQRDRV